MFLGHFAVGFAAKRAVPEASLATGLLAAQWADVVWPIFLITGLETVRIAPGNTAMTPLDFISYPYSHSLLALALWAAGFGGIYFWRRRDALGAGVLAGAVLSHWLLDFATHGPDMPLVPGGARYGLGLWRSVPATVTIELLMFAAGLAVYLRATKALDGVGRWGLIGLVTLMVVFYFGAAFGPPPPSIALIQWSALAGAALLIAFAGWVDRHRARRVGES
ncbi:MAG: hypothetical protein ABI609_02750 [Acidobacteriota bacterium]